MLHARLLADLLIPFSVKECMVLFRDVIVLGKELLDNLRIVIRTHSCLRDAEVVDACRDPHLAKVRARENRMLDHLEERGLELRRKVVVDSSGYVEQVVPRLDDHFCSSGTSDFYEGL